LGHELILNIPIETKEGQADASARYTLLTTNPDTDNIKILEKLLGLAEGFNALYSDDNEVFTNSADKLKIILEVLKRGNKHFIYGAGYKNHSTIQDLNALNYSLLISDLELDDNVSVDAINAKFVAMEKIANEKGYVVAMAHAYPITINILQTWLQKAEEKGFVVSPLSVLLGKTIK
jgi:polysaccharide deacetylase 2 family uncharacterized protein YibQ